MPTKKKAGTARNAPVVQKPVVPIEIPAVEQDAPADTPSPFVGEAVAPEPGPYHGRHTFHRLETLTPITNPVTTDMYRCVCGAKMMLTAETRFSRRQPATIKVRMRGE